MNSEENKDSMARTLPETPAFFKTWGNLKTAVLGSFTAMMFGMAILILSLLAVSNPTAVFPNDKVATSSAAVKEDLEIKYYLPYPGILPDSPLYRVKMLRDKVQLMLIFDPIKKSQKELLFADKRINAALVLVDGGKMALGVTTATKAEKYLDESANEIISVQKQGKDVKSWLLTLKTAAAKHKQILSEMQMKLVGTDRMVVEKTILQTDMVRERIEQSLMDSK